MNFIKAHKKTFIIISCVLAGVLLAAIATAVVLSGVLRASQELSSISYIDDLCSAPTESATVDNGIRLVITSPQKTDVSVESDSYTITGTSDPAEPLTLNGNAVERAEDGSFALEVELKIGPNTFAFEHKGETHTYTIRYNYVVIKAYAPSTKQQYDAGSAFNVVALCRIASTDVTATFNGATITLERQPYNEGDEFANFTGTFNMPSGNEDALNLGGVTFSAVCNGIRNKYTTPAIICPRDTALDGTQVVEIVAEQAETFNGDTADDVSRPTNSYLPKGTLDYKIGSKVYDAGSGNTYYKLRCGKRVYLDKKNAPDVNRVTVSKMYVGELPEYNTISLASNEISGKHTVLTFDTAWRAPFAVTIAPQSYTNPAQKDYTISSATYSYIDIKFFYTKGLDGDYTIPADNPIFSRSEIYSAEDGFVLRLHLKKVGAFYGWHADYNAAGQLVFSFLNPVKLRAAGNLTGAKILIDAGHGGRDPGAESTNKTTFEAERNLSLAYKLKAQLEALGATVVMTRTDNYAVSADERCSILRREAPDLCISIHHDANDKSTAHGGGIYYFDAFSEAAAGAVMRHTEAAQFYRRHVYGFHYFYMCRVTACPVVLTENGFITNPDDFAGIKSDAVNEQKAAAMVRGIVEYFNSIN